MTVLKEEEGDAAADLKIEQYGNNRADRLHSETSKGKLDRT